MELPERRSPQEMAVSAVGAGLATLLGFIALPAGPLAVAAAGAMLAPYTTRMVELAAAEWSRKADVIAESALSASGLGDPEGFCARLSSNPDLIALAQKILWAASMSGNEDKLRTLGRLLGGAVASRGDRLDETQLLVSALADIEEPHVVVLDILTGPAPDDEKYGQKAADDAEAARAKAANPSSFRIPPHRDSDEAMAYEPHAWLPDQIQQQLPMAPGFVLACLSVLTRHNLVATLPTYGGGARFKITDFGSALVKVMRQANPRPTGSGWK